MASDEKRPAYLWYPKDYLTDENVAPMTLEEEGAYRRLLDYCWLHGSLPGDMKQLASMCKIDGTRMAALWPAIRPCFRRHPTRKSRWISPRLAKEREALDQRRADKKKAGKMGAEARWGKKADA